MGYIVNSMMMAIVYISIGGRAGSGAAVAEGFDWEFLVKHYLYIRWWMLRLAMDHGTSERRERRGHRHINLPVAQHHRQYIFSTPLPMPAFTFTRPLLKIACGVCFWWTAQGTRTTTTPIVTISLSISITIRSNTLSTLCLLLRWWKWWNSSLDWNWILCSRFLIKINGSSVKLEWTTRLDQRWDHEDDDDAMGYVNSN